MSRLSHRVAPPSNRRGIVLLVMLSLLGLFTAIAMTFVLASGQFRRGAVSASRVEQQGDRFEGLLQQAMLQVARGSTHPHSAIGPHSLLEDIYGNADTIVGVVRRPEGDDPTNEINNWRTHSKRPSNMFLKIAGRSMGWDRKPGQAGFDDNGNGTIDEIAELGMNGSDPDDDANLGRMRVHPFSVGLDDTPANRASMPYLDHVDNYYAGRVITFISGEAAGQSGYIVRSKIVYLVPTGVGNPVDIGSETILWISTPDGMRQPLENDQFVINGRPFSGTGFGSTPFLYDTDGNRQASTRKPRGPLLRALDMPYSIEPAVNTAAAAYADASNQSHRLSGKVPVALTPNPVDFGYRNYLNKYWPLVDADEDYDAPDYQNMMLAKVDDNGIIPSLHRPDLVRYFHSTILQKPDATRWWLNIPPSIRRRIILRPDPADHHDTTMLSSAGAWSPGEPFTDVDGDGVYTAGIDLFDTASQDMNMNGQYDAGDPPFANAGFDAMGNGSWDVDNDGDGKNDSIWVDLGFPVVTSSDGRLMKPMAAIMVIDLDGRVNVNAHGTPKHYSVTQEVLNALDQAYVTVTGQTYTVSTGSTGGQLRMPKNNPGTPSPTSEERNFIGPTAFGNHVVLPSGSNPGKSQSVSSQIIFGKFPDYPATNRQRWAGAYDGEDVNKWYIPDLVIDDPPPVIVPAFGQGYSVADVNLAAVLGRASLGVSSSGNPGKPVHSNGRSNPYRELLEGPPPPGVTATGSKPATPGRYGEAHLRRDEESYYPGLGVVPRPGRTKMELAAGLYPVSAPLNSVMVQTGFNVSDTFNDGIWDDNIPGVIGLTARTYGSTNAVTTATSTRQALAWGNSRDAYQQQNELFNGGTYVAFGDYGTPGDHDSNGVVGLDLAGQPIFASMGTRNETIDEPTELNLNRRYSMKMTLAGKQFQGAGDRADLDAPFTPAEMERMLRIRETDSVAGMSSRLTSILGLSSPNDNITTESWDIPCPHVAPTPELAEALYDLGLPVTNPSVGDLLRARFYLTHGSTLTAQQVGSLGTIAMRSYKFVNATSDPAFKGDLRRNRTRLISPEVAMGLRMDVNAPFGNGADDNNNGIVDEPGENNPLLRRMDGSAPSGGLNFDGNRDGNNYQENARQRFAKDLYCLMMLLLDQNYVTPLAQPINGVNEAISTGLTLPLTLGSLPPHYTTAEAYAAHWLTARRIAQWAVNVVDFRDRDSIMTAFEFDADPFFDNDGDTAQFVQFHRIKDAGAEEVSNDLRTNGTWDVDDDPTPLSTAGESGPQDYDDTTKPWRGIVWGCEYPDLLLTETLAFHDRRVQNRFDDNGAGSTMTTPPVTGTFKLAQYTAGDTLLTFTTIGSTTYNLDPHWDQGRVPQGSAFIELFATGNANVAATLPHELYDIGTTSLNDGSALTVARLRLSQTVQGWPVWRLAITQGRIGSTNSGPGSSTIVTRPKNDVAQTLANYPNTCSLDPADAAFSIVPWMNRDSALSQSNGVVIERVVTFCDTASVPWAKATAGLNVALTDTSLTPVPTTTIDVYHSHDANAYAFPGDYVVLGPHRSTGTGGASPEDVTTMGRTTHTGFTITDPSGNNALVKTTTNLIQQPLISLAEDTNGQPYFLATSPDSRNEYPIYTGMFNAVNTLGSSVGTTASVAGDVSYSQIRPPVVIACATTAAGAVTDTRRGLNISEPTNARRPLVYKTQLTVSKTDTWNANFDSQDYIELNPPSSPVATTDKVVDDEPWDGWKTNNSDLSNILNDQLDDIKDHTTLRYKSVFLQRLANPLLPWNRYENPYITMDWMPFDLTVFNGEPWSEQATFMNHLREPGNAADRTTFSNPNYAAEDRQVRFGSRQRGAPRFPAFGNFSYLNLWQQPDWLATNPEMDTRPPLTNRMSDDPNGDTYGLGRYSYHTATSSEFRVKWQDPLQHTLGYINQPYHYRRQYTTYYTPSAGTPTPADCRYQGDKPTYSPMVRPASRTVGNVDELYGWLMAVDFMNFGNPNDPGEAAYYQYLGAPWRPFNWLTWNNRPFAGPMELMLVPSSAPSRLLYEFDMRRAIAPGGGGNPADRSTSGNHYIPEVANTGGAWPAGGYTHRPPYGHLLNFFDSSPATPAITGTTAAANFFRLFEFVTVPSRFSGTRKMHANAQFCSVPGVANDDEHAAWPFTAPFNYISEYREPGRVNLNTMPGSSVWRAVTNDFFPDTSGFPAFAKSNQSTGENYNKIILGLQAAVPNRPSAIGNPFRSYLEAYGSVLSGSTSVDAPNLPNVQLNAHIPTRVAGSTAITYTNAFLAVDSTLLRRGSIEDVTYPYDTALSLTTADQSAQYDPLFTLNFPATTQNGYNSYLFYRWGVQGIFPPNMPENQNTGSFERYYSRITDYRNSDRSPFFRYQLYNKLSNIATTRSNVYAIWITIGFFEVERVPMQQGARNAVSQAGNSNFSPGDDVDDPHRFPTGYRLLREFGSDTGDTVRHKAFALFDRTIPVGFLRGEDLNVDKAFLLRRVLY